MAAPPRRRRTAGKELPPAWTCQPRRARRGPTLLTGRDSERNPVEARRPLAVMVAQGPSISIRPLGHLKRLRVPARRGQGHRLARVCIPSAHERQVAERGWSPPNMIQPVIADSRSTRAAAADDDARNGGLARQVKAPAPSPRGRTVSSPFRKGQAAVHDRVDPHLAGKGLCATVSWPLLGVGEFPVVMRRKHLHRGECSCIASTTAAIQLRTGAPLDAWRRGRPSGGSSGRPLQPGIEAPSQSKSAEISSRGSRRREDRGTHGIAQRIGDRIEDAEDHSFEADGRPA